jgi:hypothetical protein
MTKRTTVILLIIIFTIIIMCIVSIPVQLYSHLPPENIPVGLALFFFFVFYIDSFKFYLILFIFLVMLFLLKCFLKTRKTSKDK